MSRHEPRQIRPSFSWDEIDCVLLDMDGTLLDKYFDDYFWEHYVPEVYATINGLSPEEAQKQLLSRYRQVEATLQWTDLDFWSEQLGLDIPELKCRIDHLIQIHPHVVDFLTFLDQKHKQIHLVTNAHSKTLAIKLRKTRIGPYFTSIICSEVVGEAKEQPVFWRQLEKIIGFDKSRTLLADDTAMVLAAAREYGIAYLVHIARPSSRKPVSYSTDFPSIASFDELLF
jgi:putative hydrolase of the HAD superfamily